MSKQPFPSDLQDKFMLRLPEGMRDRIKAAADRNNRSMNAEIVLALEYWLEFDLPFTLPLGPGAQKSHAISQARRDRADATGAIGSNYAEVIDNAIQALTMIRKGLAE